METITKIKHLYDSALAMGWLQLVVGTIILFISLKGSFDGYVAAFLSIVVGALYIFLGKRIKDRSEDMIAVKDNAKKIVWVSGIITALNVLGTLVSPLMGAAGIANTLFNALVLWYAIVVVRIKN